MFGEIGTHVDGLILPGAARPHAEALANLARDDANRVTIAEAGGIEPLIKLLDDFSENARFPAARALAELANNDAVAVKIEQAGGIQMLALKLAGMLAGAD